MTDISVEWMKWPATPYRVTPMTRLGSDDLGTWLFAPKGAAASYVASGSDPLPVNFLTLVPAGDQWWMATWMWGSPTRDIELYVDIVHPPAWVSETCLRVVDLDLDVIRYRDGSVVIDDEDEFEKHRVSLSYPDQIVSSARSTSKQVVVSVAAGESPFLRPPERWLGVLAEDRY